MHKHMKEIHGRETTNTEDRLSVSRKCCVKLDFLIYEMFYFKQLKPTLNKISHLRKVACAKVVRFFSGCFKEPDYAMNV